MRTTIDLPDELFRDLKVRAARDGLKLKDLVARFVEAGLRDYAPANGSAPRRRSEFPIIRMASGQPLPALTNADIEDILLAEDIERLKAARD